MALKLLLNIKGNNSIKQMLSSRTSIRATPLITAV